jgi:hypothetical protein
MAARGQHAAEQSREQKRHVKMMVGVQSCLGGLNLQAQEQTISLLENLLRDYGNYDTEAARGVSAYTLARIHIHRRTHPNANCAEEAGA